MKVGGALAPPGVYGITHLGYPIYFLTMLSIWKILGVVAVLIPKFPLLKEWAYAGFFFVMSRAVSSHISSGDPVKELFSFVATSCPDFGFVVSQGLRIEKSFQ